GGPSCCRGAGTYSHGQRDELRTLGTADMRRRRVRAGVAAPRLAAHEVHAETLAADAVRDLQREVADPGSGQALEQLRGSGDLRRRQRVVRVAVVGELAGVPVRVARRLRPRFPPADAAELVDRAGLINAEVRR